MALAGPVSAQTRDDALQLMGASFALTTFCPDLRYSNAALETLEVIYGIDIADEATAEGLRHIRKTVGAALEDGRSADEICPFARAWFGPAGAVLPGLLIDK